MMKYCTSCGKELGDHAKFCTGCGAKCTVDVEENIQPVQVSQELPQKEELPNVEPACHRATPANEATPEREVNHEEPIPQTEPEQQSEHITPPTKKKKPISKGKIILFGIIGVVLAIGIAAAVLVFRWYNSTEQQILRAFDSGDYDSAVDIMKKDTSASESKSLIDQLLERISNIQTGFIDGTIEYSSAMMELDTIKKLKVDGVSAELDAVRSYIDDLNGSRTNFATAESFYTTGDYAEAITNYRLVIEEDANYAAAVEKLADAVNKYRDAILEKANEYASAELYTDAVALLNETLKTIPNDTKITEQIRIYEKDHDEKLKADALTTAAAYANNGDHLSAFKSLIDVMNSQAADAELVSAYNSYCEAYVAQVVAEANAKIEEKDFDGALAVLNTAQKNLPDNESIGQLISETKAKRPISITSLEPVVVDNWGEWNTADAKDTFGNDYSTACNYMKLSEYGFGVVYRNHSAEYRLYGKYSTLTGSIAPHSDSYNGKISYLQIFIDDVLVYTSDDIGRKTDSINFSIDVSDADYVKINVYTENSAAVILYNVQLWP